MGKVSNNASGKSMTKNTLYYVVYNVLNIIFPFFTSIYVARVLLASDIGEVTYASNIAQYFVIISYLGIPTYGMREIAKARNNQKELNKIFTELYLMILVSTVFFLSVYVVLIFSVPQFRNNLPVFLISGASIALNTLYIPWLFEGLEEFRFISIRNLAFKILIFVLLVIFVRKPEDYLIYAALTVLGTAGNYILNAIYARRFVRFSFKELEFKKHIKPVLLLMVVYIAIELYSLVDVTMLGNMCEKVNVTYYSYGQRINKILLHIINAFTMVIVPRLSFYFKENKNKEFNNLVTQTLESIVLLATPLIIGLCFTSTTITSLLYGEAFVASGIVLMILSLTLLISPIGYLLGSRILLAAGKESLMPISVVAGALVNIVGNTILIPLLAEYGAAIASVISEVVVMIIYVVLGKKYYSIQGIKSSILKISGASLIMAVFLLGIKLLPINDIPKLFIQIGGSVILYPTVLIALKEPLVMKYVVKIKRKIKRSNG